MNKQEIENYNRLCAEFLNLHRDKDTVIYKMMSYPYDFLKFHSDWNWIKEVVEAIERCSVVDEFRIESFQVVVRAWITPKHNLYKIFSCEPDTKKETVVQGINQFLIWYNNEYKNRR